MGFAAFDEGYPWDELRPYAETARAHPGGIVDLSIGTPVDPTPLAIQAALREAADSPGYPTVAGSLELREAMAAWWARRRRTEVDETAVLPTIGSKEFVGLLPSMLGIGPGDAVVIPTVAYPTYAVGARLAGASVVPADDPQEWAGRADVRLVWINSPSNPTGAVIPAEHQARIVAAAREVGAVVAADECYAELPWNEPWTSHGVPCLLEDAVSGGDHTGLLAAYSLSKQSNLAGYRAAFVAGDPELIARLTLLRRHLGMMLPAPVQAAMLTALTETSHVLDQRRIYLHRRERLLGALERAGYGVDHSDAGLYLWARKGGRTTWDLVGDLAELGILVGPGTFYGPGGEGYVRIALSATDERITAAAARLGA
ncbi:succinyldiaminopimelate transaminase [Pseudactinotalea sp. HY158]|uniref:succinyldiaminopimelate transaminase n=1 Tax=Pseudactinotalea sp. HY158 TaxID=2654547 RepID=UPI00129CA8A7|nr:succinyldiaminopimelate transaminase [Pseudactinotalea sp. HY158]QGH68771.1 succinyldiaminopimelate transaminase [Pseudactinotalea sp. HY158]